jgi:hypothetical protein
VFHEQYYAWLILREARDTLYKIKSRYLIPFLLSNEVYVDILRSYYVINEMFKPAALLLSSLAYKKTDQYLLKDRIGFLTSAIACATTVVDSGNHRSSDGKDEATIDADEVFRLRDRVSVYSSSSFDYRCYVLTLMMMMMMMYE